MTQHIQQLEGAIDDLFDQVCPPVAGGQRALKPFLTTALGSLLLGPNRRQILDRRAYYRLDFVDFLDFATSSIPRPACLSAFQDGEAHFYQALNIDSPEPHVELPAPLNDLAILDVVLARNSVFLSVTMRLKSLAAHTQPLALVTMTLAPCTAVDTEHARLDEWDRCWIGPPVPGDPEWRFIQSGIYTDYLLDDMERHPGKPGALAPAVIERARASSAATHGEYAGLFELARLALCLPQYFEFMYDLIVSDTVPAKAPGPCGQDIPSATPRSGSVPRGPLFRVIKSLRVIRATTRAPSTWTAPRYSFAVAGHWRRFGDPETKGHDATGQVVPGRTWVHDYSKFKDKAPRPGTTTSDTAEPRVVINIKQSLAYARDVLATASTPPAPNADDRSLAVGTPAGERPAPAAPSAEWMAAERAKLTFQLRYLILRRDDFRCRLCGRSAASDSGVRLEVDHQIPVSKWGLTEESNLWTLCRECNRGKTAHSLHVS